MNSCTALILATNSTLKQEHTSQGRKGNRVDQEIFNPWHGFCSRDQIKPLMPIIILQENIQTIIKRGNIIRGKTGNHA